MRHHPRAREASKTAVDMVMAVLERRFPDLGAAAAKVGWSAEELKAWAGSPVDARISEFASLLLHCCGPLPEGSVGSPLPDRSTPGLPSGATPRRDYPSESDGSEEVADDPRRFLLAVRDVVELLIESKIVTEKEREDCFGEVADVRRKLDPPSR
jgi:hypothetical protein